MTTAYVSTLSRAGRTALFLSVEVDHTVSSRLPCSSIALSPDDGVHRGRRRRRSSSPLIIS
jgi:hypothetical protein